MYTNDVFVDKVTLYGALPDGRYQPEEILGVGYDMLVSNVVPLIISLNEEYYVRSESQAVTASRSSYPIPKRALGSLLREAKHVLGKKVNDLDRISPEEVTSNQEGSPDSFYLKGLNVILYPTPNSTEGTLELSYYLTPSLPVLVAAAALITNIDTSTGEITATTPAGWSTSNTFDLVSARNGHETLAFELAASAVTSSSVTFTAGDLPSTLQNGDYISLSGYSPYMQCPDLAFQYLIQITANEFLRNMAATAELQNGLVAEGKLLQALTRTMSNRVLGAPKPFTINPNDLR